MDPIEGCLQQSAVAAQTGRKSGRGPVRWTRRRPPWNADRSADVGGERDAEDDPDVESEPLEPVC